MYTLGVKFCLYFLNSELNDEGRAPYHQSALYVRCDKSKSKGISQEYTDISLW